MKRWILTFIFLISIVSVVSAQQYLWRYRTHATNCQLLTDGKTTDLCYEQDSRDLYKCMPDSGDCSSTEWKKIQAIPDSTGVTDSVLGVDGSGNVNWYDSFILKSNAINWSDVELMQAVNSDAINWEGNEEINSADINWTNIQDLTAVKSSAINWQLSQEIKSADINWTNIKDLQAISSTAINWQSLEEIANGNINWSTVNLGSTFAVPSGTNPTVDSAGEIAVDTTSDRIEYYGGAKRVIGYQRQFCFALEDPVDADDDVPIYFPKEAITVTDVYCEVDGGTSVAMTISDGTNALEAITCDGDGAEDDGSIANGTFTANERMEIDLDSTSGTNTWLAGCVTYVLTED